MPSDTPPKYALNAAGMDRPAWLLDEVVLSLDDAERGRRHSWSRRDAFEGVQIFGATGSGKTSGSGRALALGLLKGRFGGLVLTAKSTDAEEWAGPNGLMKQAGRNDRPIILGPESRWKDYRTWGVEVPPGGHRLNFLDFEFQRLRSAGINPSFNLVALFEAAVEVGRPGEPSSSNEPFWQDTFRQLLQNALDLAVMADDAVSLARIKDIAMSAPQTREEACSSAWRAAGGACWECLQKAQARFDRDEPPRFYDEEDFRQVAGYWLVDLAGLSWKTKSNILTMFTSKADSLLRSPLRQLFCPEPDVERGGGYTCAPDQTFDGRVVILDFPIKSFGETGRFVQVLYKTLWQLSAEDRPLTVTAQSGSVTGGAPVFLWADESQYFVVRRDLAFQLTARSKCVCTVYLTQNLPNYFAMLSGADSRSVAESLVGNLQTKIFHANGDPTTNGWAESLFGHGIDIVKGRTLSLSGDRSTQRSETFEPLVRDRDFAVLRKGGPTNEGVVEGIVFQAGRRWDSQDTERGHVLRTAFDQSVL